MVASSARGGRQDRRAFRYATPVETMRPWLAVVLALTTIGCGRLCRRGRGEPTDVLDDAAAVEAIDSPIVRSIRGGPTLVALAHGESPVTALQIWSPRGTADEPADVPGAAELCARLSCERLPVPEGVELVTWASHDATVCELSAPRELGDELLSHLGKLLRLPEDAPDAARARSLCKTAAERWRESRGNAKRLAAELIFSNAFGADHRYGRPVMGEPSCSSDVIERLGELCEGWFSSSELTVTAVGDISPHKLSVTLSHLDRGESSSVPSEATSTDERGSGTTTVATAPIEHAEVAVAFRADALTPEGRARTELLVRLLEDREPVSEWLTDSAPRELARGRGGFVFEGREGALMVVTESVPPVEALEAASRLAADALGLANQPLLEASVARARLAALDRHQLARSDSQRLARSLGYDQVVGGDAELGAKVRRAIVHATPAELQRAASKLFVAQRMTTVVILPEHLESDRSSLPVTTDDMGASRVDTDHLTEELEQRLHALFEQRESPSWAQLPDGLSWLRGSRGEDLLVRAEPHSSVVAIRAALPLAGEHLEAYTPGAITALRHALSRRLEEHVSSAVAPGFRVGVPDDVQAIVVEGVFLRRHLDSGLRFLLAALVPPTTESPIETDDRGLNTIAAVDAEREPLRAGRLVIREALHPADHALWEAEGLIGRAASVEDEEVLRLHQALINAGRIIISVAGPVSADEVYRSMVTALPFEAVSPPDPAPATDRWAATEGASGGREIRRVVDLDRTRLWIAFVTSGISQEDRYTLEVIAALLGSERGQPRRRVVEAGLATEVAVERWEGRGTGHIALFAETTSQNEAAVRGALMSVISELCAEPVTDYELGQARQLAASHAARRLSTPMMRAGAVERALLLGLPPGALLETPARVLEVSAEDVHSLARRIMSAGHELTVVVGRAPPDEEVGESPTTPTSPASSDQRP